MECLKEWAEVCALFVAILTLLVTIVLTISIFCLERKFRKKQKQRKDVELIMDWATRILYLQNEYLLSKDLLEIKKKSNELLREYWEIEFLAAGLDPTINDRAKSLYDELRQFHRKLDKIKYKPVPHSAEIQQAVLNLLQESVNFRNKL